MRMRSTITALAIATVTSLGAAACGNWNAPLPSSPSALPSPLDDVPSNGATIVGTLNGGAAGISPALASGTSDETVSVDGTNITASVSVTGTFVLKDVPSGNITLRFSGSQSGTVRVDHVDVQERIDIKIKITASSASIDAVMRIKADNSTEIDGEVTAIAGTCPRLNVQVSTWSTSLSAESDGHCSDIRVGIRLHIRGRMSDRVVVVVNVDVNVQSSPSPGPAPAPHDGDDDDDD